MSNPTQSTPIAELNPPRSSPHRTDVEMQPLDDTTNIPPPQASTQSALTAQPDDPVPQSLPLPSPELSKAAGKQPATEQSEGASTEAAVVTEIPRVDGAADPGEQKPAPATVVEPVIPKVGITLLMPSGHRSEWRFDCKYLERRNVKVPEGDPFKISVYTLKELMLREWKDEWGAKPLSPNAIRLITLGKLLDEKSTLQECRFSTESLTILHMTVKPQDMMDEEDARMNKNSTGRSGESGRMPRCSCVIL
ncbi:MAG: hypothetical protein M1814_000709 [Vezdaea aestivalis]|nr:MAG: hypothetical protein M1814_000709 [Vezdaea aestivalis]